MQVRGAAAPGGGREKRSGTSWWNRKGGKLSKNSLARGRWHCDGIVASSAAVPVVETLSRVGGEVLKGEQPTDSKGKSSKGGGFSLRLLVELGRVNARPGVALAGPSPTSAFGLLKMGAFASSHQGAHAKPLVPGSPW